MTTIQTDGWQVAREIASWLFEHDQAVALRQIDRLETAEREAEAAGVDDGQPVDADGDQMDE